MTNITQEMINTASGRFGVSPEIHPDDFIYRFLVNHPGFLSDMNRVMYYFADGAKSASKLLDLVAKYGDGPRASVLEFASGYGCVSRHLVKNDKIDLVSSDIHGQAIDFLTDKIGAKALLSASVPENFAAPRQFDVVFALSFFSHMPITTWARWLVRLTQVVRPGGLIIFTTQGLLSAKYVGCEAVPDIGFWFKRQSEQGDLSVDEYGQTVVTQEFVTKNVDTISGAELVEIQPGGWWEHQDVYVLRRT
jgi:cyclopropane fatty-acyl-phospholipid synthase-like methyltransferase